MPTIEDLINFGFLETHKLVFESDSLRFNKICDSSKVASVYLWVACQAGRDPLVLYVGKAGKGVDLRCSQHMGGFKNSGTGRKNAIALRQYIADGYEISVYTRRSESIRIYNQEVSLYSVEEDAFCELLNPVLNRALFPNVNQLAGEEGALAIDANFSKNPVATAQLVSNRLVQSSSVSSDELFAQLEAYTEEQRSVVRQLLIFIESQLTDEYRGKLVAGYSEQPPGCNARTTLTFAIPGSSGQMRGGSWRARIYFGEEPRVGFPLDRLNPGARDNVDIVESKRVFSPKSSDEFLRNPGAYVIQAG